MSKRVLLLSMPFASIRYPSPALSQLKAVVQKEGIPCDVAYMNIFFQHFSDLPEVYEGIADFMIIGETVFGAELFGKPWAQSDQGRLNTLEAPFLPSGQTRDAIRTSLIELRQKAGPFMDQCLQMNQWDDVAVVGFTSVYSQHVASLALAKKIKQLWPDKIIAFGGANCEGVMGEALMRLFPFVDWVFNGEGDLAFPRAVKQWLAGTPPEGIDGVAFRRDGEIVTQGAGRSPELNRLPYPDFDDYFSALQKWAASYRFTAPISLELSRGCWWGSRSQCVFCGLHCGALKYRRKGAKRAESEIKSLTARHGVDKVILSDAILDMSFFKTLLPELARWGGLEELFVEARANLNREQVGILKAAGVQSFQPGIESLDSQMLALMRKGTTLLQNVQFLKWAQEYGLNPTWNLLYGFPGEPAEAYRRMALLIPAVAHLRPPMDLSPVLLVRFSPLFDQSREMGIHNIRAHRGYHAVYPFGQRDLDALAYFFDFDFSGKHDIAAYIEPLKQRVGIWKQLWAQPHPPALTFESPGENRVVIYDSRPGQKNHRLELGGEKAAAYQACDAMRRFDELAGVLKEKMGKRYNGDASLRQSLEKLVAHRLMLQENNQYLSLATRPGYQLDVSEEW